MTEVRRKVILCVGGERGGEGEWQGRGAEREREYTDWKPGMVGVYVVTYGVACGCI